MSTRSSPSFAGVPRGNLGKLILLLAAGSLGGAIAFLAGLPLPFMLGGLLTTLLVLGIARNSMRALFFPNALRMFFVGVIGTMIGGTFTADIVVLLPSLALSVFGIVVYVLIAHTGGYFIARRLGGYDPVTAFYASMPAGLIEAVELGKRAGANARVLMLSHFLRVFSVVLLVPMVFWVIEGDVVGSAGGQTFTHGESTLVDIALITATTLLGLGVGRRLHVPAAHLLGPMLISGALHGTGVIEISSPDWLLYTAQLVVGVVLGTQFSRASGGPILPILKTTLGMLAYMLLLSVVMAFALAELTNLGRVALFLSFAPGGVTEMGLIALSLSLSPVVVAAHHVPRIFATVAFTLLGGRIFRLNETTRDPPKGTTP